MSRFQEQPNFNQFTPASFTAYVRENQSLPKLNAGELEQLNSAMTQADVIEYYVAVRTIRDKQKRKELLEQWIPKPKVLYHASKTGGVAEFEPRGRYKRQPDDPPQVFGATSEAVAAVMLAPGDNRNSKSGSYDGGKTWTFIFVDSEEFRQADTGGYIYELPPDDFACDPGVGLGLAEWTSIKPVKPAGQPKHYSSSIEAMLQHGVKVYPVDQETFLKFQDENVDDVSLLKTLKPL